MNRILLMDDEAATLQLVANHFGAEGFEVESVARQEQAVRLALSGRYALLVLDVSLPDFNGFEILSRIRAESSVPILVVTARSDDASRILGLEIGADDYLAKPFNPRELIARIRAILRRSQSSSPATFATPESLVAGDLELNRGAWIVRCAGKQIDLSAVEFRLLEALIRSAGRVLTRQELVETVLGRHFSPLDRSVDMHISNLRRKLNNGVNGKSRIRTVHGVGYVCTKALEVPTAPAELHPIGAS